MYIVSSGLVSRGLRLRIPDVSPASVVASSEVAASTVTSEVLEVGFLANVHWPRVSCQSRLSTNDKDKNEMIPETMHRSPGIYLTTEENSEKPQLGFRR